MPCSDVLVGGVFDTIMVDRTATLETNIFEWLKSSSYQETKKEVDAGLDVKDIFGGTFSEDTHKQWKSDVDSGLITGIKSDHSFKVVASTASQPILDAWLACEGQPGGLSATVQPSRGGRDRIFSFNLRYVPNAVTDLPPTIHSVQVGNGNLVPGGPITAGTQVGYGGISAQIERVHSGKETPVALHVTDKEIYGPCSITVNTDKGSVVEVVPPVTDRVVTTPPPKPPQQHVFQHQVAGSMSKDSGETGWFAHNNIFQLPDGGWIDTTRGGGRSNAELPIEAPKGYDILFHRYPDTLMRSVYAVNFNLVNRMVNVFVTLMGQDKGGKERYRATVTVYYSTPG